MERPSRTSSWRRSPYFQATSASPPPSPSAGRSATSPSSPAGSVLKPTSWQQTSSSKAHSQLNPHHHQRRNTGRTSRDFSFSTPEPRDAIHGASSMSSRMRTRTGDSSNSLGFPDAKSPETAAADLDDGPSKGGHSLRKRARVQYATEQIEDEVTVPNSSSSSASRNRKRSTQEDEVLYGPRPKRRNTSHSDSPSSSLRRNPSRRNTANRRYQDGSDAEDFADLAENEPRWEEPRDDMPAARWPSAESSPSSRANKTNANFSGPSPSEQPDYQHQLNGNQWQDQTLFSSPAAVEATPIVAGDITNVYNHQNQNDEYYDQPLQYQPDHPDQGSMMDYPDLASNMDDSHMPGDGSLSTGPPLAHDTALFAGDQNMLPEDSSIYEEGAVAPQTMFDESQIAEATPPVDPQLMALVDPSAAQSRERSTAATLMSSAASPQESIDEQFREKTRSVDDPAENHQDGSTSVRELSATGASTPTRTTPGATLEPEKPNEALLEPHVPLGESSLRETLKDEPSPEKPPRVLDPRWCRPQPTPVGRWSNLTPYVNGDYTVYPERKLRLEDDDAASDAPSATDKDSDEKDSGKEGEADTTANENADAQESVTELPTPAVNTSARGSPVAEVPDLAAVNSPMPPGEEPEDRDSSQEPTQKSKHYRFRKLNDPEEYVTALQNYEDMNSADLYQLLQTCHASLETWEEEWVEHGKTVDDYENAQRRRIADIKYENRTRNLEQTQPMTWEEPEFTVKGYKAKGKETLTETKYLQGQDRTMAAAYGFEYDPHPSKIGKQNPETQQAGVTTRGRSLRNQPRQTAKATETDGAIGKRQRKAAQMLETATQDASRASSPAPGRGGRRRRNVNAETEDNAPEPTPSATNEANVDIEVTGPGRRKRGGRGGRGGASRIAEKQAPEDEPKEKEQFKSTGRRGRPKASAKYDVSLSAQREQEQELPQLPKRRIVTLRIPRGATIVNSGLSPRRASAARPSTAGSESSSYTVESSYGLRPKRQKRFRDEPDDSDSGALGPAKKRSKRATFNAKDNNDMVMADYDDFTTPAEDVAPSTEATETNGSNKPRIKVVRPGSRSRPQSAAGSTPAPTPPSNTANAFTSEEPSRNGTPASQVISEGDDGLPKEYRTMTKSEKMSASMKNRWKNGNMAGAVEKRKATLAAKKAAQATIDQRQAPLASKQPKVRTSKKETTLLPGENAAFMHAQPPAPAHLAHNHNSHPHQPIQSMPSLSQQQIPHHQHQLPQNVHQHMHHQPHPYGHQDHLQYTQQHPYGQPLPPQSHHQHHLPPPQHHQPPPPPHHHMQHQHHPPQHPQYPHHEYPGVGHPFPSG